MWPSGRALLWGSRSRRFESGYPDVTKIFMVEYRAGRVSAADIDDYVDEWHDSPAGSPAAAMHLHEFLGMTRTEYFVWGPAGKLPKR